MRRKSFRRQKVALILSLSKDDAPALAVAAPVVADAALAAALGRDDRRDAFLPQVGAQPVGIVALVGGQAADAAGRCGQNLRGRAHVTGIARRQQEDAGTAQHIGEGVDLGGLATPRRADRLRLGPPFPPCAERWALT